MLKIFILNQLSVILSYYFIAVILIALRDGELTAAP
jgi:hypothetical protein